MRNCLRDAARSVTTKRVAAKKVSQSSDFTIPHG
jgi:hypothetical protein